MYTVHILELYFFRLLRKWFLRITWIVAGLSGLLEWIEQIRRSSASKLSISHFGMLQIVLLKLPALLFDVLPAIVFIASVFFLLDLKNNRELLALFASGLSPFRILRQTTIFLVSFSLFSILIFQPISAICSKFGAHLPLLTSRNIPTGFITNNMGIWIQDHQSDTYRLVQAQQFGAVNQQLRHVTMNCFEKSGKHQASYTAQYAILRQHQWQLIDGNCWTPTQQTPFRQIQLPTLLQDLQALSPIDPPNQVTIFQLIPFIRQLQQRGLPTTAYRHSFHQWISIGLSSLALMMLAFTFIQRWNYATSWIFGATVGITIGLHCLQELMRAFVLAERLPVWMGVYFLPILLCIFSWMQLRTQPIYSRPS